MAVPTSTFIDIDITLSGAAAEAFNFGVPMIVGEHTVTANRQDGPYASLAEVVAAGFTSGVEPQIYAAAAATFSQSPTVDSVMIGRRDVLDANIGASMDAILAVDPTAWYCTVLDTRVDADVTGIASWTAANGTGDFPKISVAQTAQAALLAGTPGNIGEVLRLASYDRTALIYHATSTDALDAAWVGRCLAFDLDGQDGVGDWAYKQLIGQTGDTLTAAQVTNILAENANIYAPAKGLSFTFDGKMPYGAPRFIDTITTADWLKVRTQEAFLSARVGAPTTIPYDNNGIQYLAGKLQEVFDLGVRAGHFVGEASGGRNPVVKAPLLKDVSEADRIARILRLSATATKRGGILTVDFGINISF